MSRIYRNPLKGKTGKDWKAEFTTGTGKTRKRLTKTFELKSQAKEWLAMREAERAEGTNYIDSEMNFAEWYLKWVKTYRESTIAPATRDTYYTTYKHLKKYMPDKTIGKLTRIDLQNYFSNRNFAKETLRKDLTHIRGALKDAVIDGVIPKNPALTKITINANPRRTKPDEKKFMSEEEYRKVRDYLLAQPFEMFHLNRMVLLVITQTGLRVGEALALKEDDLDLKTGLLRVDESYDAHHKIIKTPKTKNAVRTIPISAQMMNRLSQWVMFHRKALFQRGVPNPDRLLFLKYDKRLPHAGGINKTYQQIQYSLGYEPIFSTHTLRHTLASILIRDQKVSVAYISKFLGHSSELVTRKYYLGLIPEAVEEERDKAVEVIENI